MKLTEALRHQLEAKLKNLEQGGPLIGDDELKALLGPKLHGEYMALSGRLGSAIMDEYQEANAKYHPPPKEVEYYKGHFHTIRKEYRSKVARLPKLRARAADAQRLVRHAEDGIATAHEEAWKLYEKVPQQHRIWMEPPILEGARTSKTWPPRVFDNVPFEALMPGHVSPGREAQMAILERLLGEG